MAVWWAAAPIAIVHVLDEPLLERVQAQREQQHVSAPPPPAPVFTSSVPRPPTRVVAAAAAAAAGGGGAGEIHDEPFLVLASDGLWDVLSFAEVAFITRRVSRAGGFINPSQQQSRKSARRCVVGEVGR